MPSGKSLPARPNLEFLRKSAKQHLASMRKRDPGTQLASAQLAVARDYGFSSWRKLKAHVDAMRQQDNSTSPQENHIKAMAELLKRKDHGGARRMLRQIPALAGAADSQGGHSMLHLAVEIDDPKGVDLLLDAGANPGALWGGHTPLSWALTCGSFKSAHALVERGVVPDLFCAAGLGDLKTVASYFAESGRLRPNASRTGSTRYGPDGKRLPCPPAKDSELVADALYIACRQARPEVAEFLLEHKPDLNFRAFMGGTALHWAHFGGDGKIIAMLVAAGLDPASVDNAFKCTPSGFGIHVPAEWGILPLVRRRLKDDLNLAKIFDGGMTPLHRVARGGRAAIVKWLLDAGADPASKDANGKTAIEVAREKNHEQVVAAIENWMPRPRRNRRAG
jgi:ankyrin repeat protein